MPYYNLFLPQKTGYADRTASFLMGEVNPRSREELTQVANYISTKSQINSFMKNGQVHLKACFQEVFRRAEQLGCEDFKSICSFERFKGLANECGKTRP
ncbi:MAG: hypothetical protein ACJASR_002494 [Psychroserpens sp.]